MALNVHREGRGRPLVLLHGVGHHWQAFTPVIGRLVAGGFEVFAIDMPGFGRSAPLDGDDLSIPAYTDAIAAWIAATGLRRPAIVGNSMGGAIALELAARGLVSDAVAVSPAGFWSASGARWCQLLLGSTRRVPAVLRPLVVRALGSGIGRRLLMSHLFARPQRMPASEARSTLADGWASPALAGALAAFSSYRCRAVPAAGTPVTVAWGSRDVLLPFLTQSRRARRMLPGARHVTLPGLGHVPFWDDPGMVARMLLGVLGDAPAQRLAASG